MPVSSSVPSTVPPTTDPAFEQRWSEWLGRCREHDRVGLRRLRIAVASAVVGAVVIGYFFYTP